MKVGDVVTLLVPCLGCTPGTKGVVFNVYEDFDQHISALNDPDKVGVQIIFKNGEYDGFSYNDQETFLKKEKVKFIPFYIREYQFQNVMKVSQDFRNGFWDEIFKNE